MLDACYGYNTPDRIMLMIVRALDYNDIDGQIPDLLQKEGGKMKQTVFPQTVSGISCGILFLVPFFSLLMPWIIAPNILWFLIGSVVALATSILSLILANRAIKVRLDSAALLRPARLISILFLILSCLAVFYFGIALFGFY